VVSRKRQGALLLCSCIRCLAFLCFCCCLCHCNLLRIEVAAPTIKRNQQCSSQSDQPAAGGLPLPIPPAAAAACPPAAPPPAAAGPAPPAARLATRLLSSFEISRRSLPLGSGSCLVLQMVVVAGGCSCPKLTQTAISVQLPPYN